LSHFQMEICDTDYCYNFVNYGIVGGGGSNLEIH